MNPNIPHPDDQAFIDLLKETPTSQEAPEDLKRKLRVMATGAKLRTRSRWAPRLAVVTVSCVVLLAVSMLIWPTSASAKSFQKVIDATNLIKNFSLTLIEETTHGKINTIEVKGSDDCIDVQGDQGLRLQIGKESLKFYEPQSNTLTSVKLGESMGTDMIGQAIQEGVLKGVKQVDIKKMLAEFRDQYGDKSTTISDIESEDGVRVYHIDLQDLNSKSSVSMTIDAETDLPILIRVEEPDSKITIRLNFRDQVQVEPIEKSMPKGVKREEVDVSKMIEQGMASAGKAFGNSSNGHGNGIRLNGKELDPKTMNEIREMANTLRKQMKKH
jgi:hypothetical protein